MANESIKFTASSDYSAVIADQRKMLAGQDKTIEKLRETARAGKSAGDAAGGGMKNAATQALKFAGALTGIGSVMGATMLVITQLKREYEQLVSRQREAAGAQIETAQLRFQALLQAPLALPKLDAMVTRVANRAGLPERDVWASAGPIFSAKGAATAEQMEAVMMTTARMRRAGGPGFEGGPLGSAMLDIIKAAELPGERAGEQAFGWIRQVGAGTRMVELGKQARAIGPTVAAARELGIKPERAAEILAAISHISADPEGRLSSTAAINFMEHIMKGEILPVGRRMKTLTGETFDERLTQLQEAVPGMTDAQQRKMWTAFGGRAKTKGAIRALAGRSPTGMATLAAAEEAIGAPSAPGLELAGGQFISDLMRHPAQKTKETAAAFDKAIDDLRQSSGEAIAGVMRERLRPLAQAAGWSDIQTKKMLAEFELATGFGRKAPVEAFKGIFGAAAERKMWPYETWTEAERGRIPIKGWAAELPQGAVREKPAPWDTGLRSWQVGPAGEPGGVWIQENPAFRTGLRQAYQGLQKRLTPPEPEPLMPAPTQTPAWWQQADVGKLLDRQRAWAGRPDRPQGMILPGQAPGDDQRTEQRHEESVGVLKDIRDGLHRIESSQRIDIAPEKPER